MVREVGKSANKIRCPVARESHLSALVDGKRRQRELGLLDGETVRKQTQTNARPRGVLSTFSRIDLLAAAGKRLGCRSQLRRVQRTRFIAAARRYMLLQRAHVPMTDQNACALTEATSVIVIR